MDNVRASQILQTLEVLPAALIQRPAELAQQTESPPVLVVQPQAFLAGFHAVSPGIHWTNSRHCKTNQLDIMDKDLTGYSQSLVV